MLGEHALGPGAKAGLTIVYDTKDRPGPFRKIVTISTEIPGQQEIEVIIEGTVGEAPGAKIQAHPRKALLGVLIPGSRVKHEITVTNKGNRPLNLTKIYSRRTGAVYRDGKREGTIVIDPETTGKVEVEITVPGNPGQVEDLLVLESNAKNAPKSGYVVMIQYTVASP